MEIDRRAFLATSIVIPSLLRVGQGAFANETLYDYLVRTQRDASFAYRKRLWSDFRPADKYTGSAEQNIELLDAIKNFDAAPQLTLKSQHVRQNDDVLVMVGAKNVGIESELCMQSLKPGFESISLGKAMTAGIYTIRATNGVSDARVLLTLVPANDGFDLSLFGAAAKLLQAAPNAFIEPQPQVAVALAHFWKELSGQAYLETVAKTLPSWLKENVGTIGETLIVCAIGSPAACAIAGGAHGFSIAVSALSVLAASSKTLSADEKQLLKTVFEGSDAAVQLASSVFGLNQRHKLCEYAAVGITGADSLAGKIEADGVRLTVRLFLQSTKKYTVILCASKL